MLVRNIPIASLKAAPYNPRKPLRPGSRAYQRLARSIETFDLVQPIVWNEQTGHVVAGHQRVNVLRDRGDADVECVVVDLSLSREKTLNIALNNAAVGSDWDGDKLHSLLLELVALPDVDATLTGFDSTELRELLLEPASPAIESDAAPAANIPAEVRATLVIPPDQWDAVRASLDALLAQHDIALHVVLPRGM